MAQIRLAKALRLKNKLAGEIAELGRRMQEYNSHREENEPPFRVDEVWQEREELVVQLVGLKTAISAANGPIQGAIFRLAENKAAIAVLKEMNIHEGVMQDRFGDTPTYKAKAQWNAVRVAEVVEDLTAGIEFYQDEIDTHNAQTSIHFNA